MRRLPFLLPAVVLACLAAPARAEIAAESWTALADSAPAQADLAQCYAWSKAQTESLRIQEEQIYQLEQQYRQVLGSALPNVGYNYSVKYLDNSKAGGSSNGGPFFQSPQPQANFVVTQPLFTGFKEFAGMAAAKRLEKSDRLQLRRAYAALFGDVSNAFYLVVNLQTQLADIDSAIAMCESRIKELRSWVDLGKSRHSEVVLEESQKAAFEAQAEALKGQIDVGRDLLSFLTGKDLRAAKLLDRMERVRSLDPEERVLGRAAERSDVRALREALAAQEQLVRVAEAAWYPTAYASGDYYNYRIAFYRPIHWDANLTLNLPIFSGGSTMAGVRLAKSQVNQAQYNLEFGLRQARSQINSAYVTLRAAVAQSSAAEKAYAKADESYRLEQKEYRLGLVTNLDVLTALNTVLASELTYDQTLVQGKLDLLLLQVSDEELTLP